MAVRALDRKLIRDLWHMRGQVFAIAVVLACGVATLVMSLATQRTLDDTRSTYYDRYRFAEVFAPLKQAPLHVAESIARVPGVRDVDARIVKDVLLDLPALDEPAVARLVSLPDGRRPSLNETILRRGRMPELGRPDEVLISEAFADAHGFQAGDRVAAIINGRLRNLEVVGIALSPEFIYAFGPGQLIPDNLRFGIFWINRESLAAAFNLEGAFNDLSVTLLRDARVEDVIDQVDRALEIYGGVGAFARKDQVSHAYLDGEIEQLATMAAIIPPIFLGVAIFLLNIALSRLIETERSHIGLLKACGYHDLAVGWHYVKFAMVIATVGCVAGLAGGTWLAKGLIALYINLFRFPFLQPADITDIYAIAILIALVAALLATIGAVRRAVRLPPAVAMTPAPPTVYRQNMLDRWVTKALAAGAVSRMIIRHVLRWPLRALLTVIGIGMSMALLVSTLFFFDSMDLMLRTYFEVAHRQDVTVTFVDARHIRAAREIANLPGVLAVEPFREVAVRLRAGPVHKRAGLTGLEQETTLRRVVDSDDSTVRPPDQGLALSAHLARKLRVGRGDKVMVEVLEGRRPHVSVPVAHVFEEYIGGPTMMSRAALNRLMDEEDLISGVFLAIDEARQVDVYRALKARPGVASVTSQTVAVRSIRETIAETMYIVIWFYTMFGGLIAAGVIYNSARVALSERGRELASLRVLGFTQREVAVILFGELSLLTAIALPLGTIIGHGIAAYLVANFETDLFRLPMAIEPATVGLSAAVVVVAAALSTVLVRRRLDRLDLIAVLKTRE